MIHLGRLRSCDPAARCYPGGGQAADTTHAWGGMDVPSIEQDFCAMELPQRGASERLPCYDDRRTIVARDPLCCSDGFRVLCRLVLRHVFGVRVCPYCPDCNSDNTFALGCQDRVGSSATCSGGVFGRVDAAFGSVENQKVFLDGANHTTKFRNCFHDNDNKI